MFKCILCVILSVTLLTGCVTANAPVTLADRTNVTPGNWQYATYMDEIRNKEIKSISVKSEDTVLSKGTATTLTIVLEDGHVSLIGFSIKSKEFNCLYDTSCIVRANFDGGVFPNEIIRIHIYEIDDEKRLVVGATQDFLKNLLASNTLAIELPIRKRGMIQYTFNVAGLDLDRPD